MTLCSRVLFGSTRTQPAVRQVYGVSGTGKSVFLCESLRMACRSSGFSPKHRFIVFDIKHDGYESLAPPVSSVARAIQSLDKDKLAVIHPPIEEADEMLDDIISWLFDVADYDPEFSATLILEESSTFIGSSVGSIPPSVKRFATQGRSKGLSLLLVNQRALSNKWADTQSSSITMFRMAIPDRKMLLDRWGVRSEDIDERLKKKKFSFAHFDLEELSLSFYDPIKIPKVRLPVVKEKRRYSGLLRNPFL
jgi:hypothetical protein